MDDAEFLELLKNHDCPEDLIKMASTKWQKGVAIEFYFFDKRLTKQEGDIIWIKRLVISIFGITLLAAVAQYIGPFLQTCFA